MSAKWADRALDGNSVTCHARGPKRNVYAAAHGYIQVQRCRQRGCPSSHSARSFMVAFSLLILISYAINVSWSENVSANKQRTGHLAVGQEPRTQQQLALAVAPAGSNVALSGGSAKGSAGRRGSDVVQQPPPRTSAPPLQLSSKHITPGKPETASSAGASTGARRRVAASRVFW